MAKKKRAILPVAKCHVEGCTEEAVFGFRETINVTNNDSLGRAKEFIMVSTPNWCRSHDAEERPLYATKRGEYVVIKASQASQD